MKWRSRIVDTSAIGLATGVVLSIAFWGLLALVAVLAGWLP